MSLEGVGMQIYFIRHGQSSNNALWSNTGSSIGRSEDPILTEVGREQAKRLSTAICNHSVSCLEDPDLYHDYNEFGFSHLYTSLMVRAIATGMEVAQALDLPLVALQDLHETGGIYLDNPETGEPEGQAGKNREQLLNLFPDLILPDTVTAEGWWNRPFESRADRLPRAKRLVNFLYEKHIDNGDRIALFSHAGFYNYFLTALMGLDERLNIWFDLNNTGITRIDIREHEPVMVYSNRTDHLLPGLLTN